MRQNGKRPSALIMFTKITLNLDLLLAGKTIALVGAVFNNVDLVIAPMTGNGSGLFFLGNFVQNQ